MMDLLGLTKEDALEYIIGERKYMQATVVEDFDRFCMSKLLDRGSVWFDSLTWEDKNKLRDKYWDPSGSNKWINILVALCILLDPDCDKVALRDAMHHSEYWEYE